MGEGRGEGHRARERADPPWDPPAAPAWGPGQAVRLDTSLAVALSASPPMDSEPNGTKSTLLT
eukprot:7118771-Prymnesium_polylepis.1